MTKTRKIWPWLLVLLLLAAGAGWVWMRQPRGYRLLAKIATQGQVLTPTLSGFFVQTKPDTFALFDWQGRLQWQAAGEPPPRLYPPATYTAAVSGDGQTCALLRAWLGPPFLSIYRRGQLTARVPITTVHYAAPALQALDDGQVLVVGNTGHQDTALLYDGTKMVGSFPLSRYSTIAISPDGGTLAVSHFMPSRTLGLSALTVTTGGVTPGTEQLFAGTPTFNSQDDLVTVLFHDGTVLTPAGHIIRRGAPTPVATGWASNTIAPEGMYTVQFHPGASRVFSPVTGDAWGFSVPGTNLGGDATSDGHFALAYYERPLPRPMQRLLEKLHLSPRGSAIARQYLDLIERPGTLRARFRMPDFGRQAMYRAWFPSPDGHGLVLNTEYNGRSECRVYRW